MSQCRGLQQTQERLLAEMVRRNADTEFGRAHGFDKIRNSDDFRRQVPIGTWETYDPYIDRIAAGQTGVLTSGPLPTMFNKTSGTTGKPKLIPVTAQTSSGNATTQKIWAFAAMRKHRDFLSGKAVPLVNKAIEGYTETTRIPYGAVSGLMFRNAHALAKRKYAYTYDVVEIEDFRARRYALMRFAVPQNVTFIPGSNPNSILKLFESADEFKADLIKDVHDGTLSRDYAIEDDLRAALAGQLKPDPQRARELERLAGQAGKLRPREYWPDLKLIGCWKGGTVGQFADRLHDWCAPDLTLRDTGYMSSEAHVSIPVSDEGSSGLLTIHTNVFEFIPEDEFGKPDARSYMAHEIEAGVPYQILLTTPGGLCRYSINDVVEATGFVEGAPLIRFLRKGRDVTNLQGEKVSANQVLGAAQASSAELGLTLTHFMFVAVAEESRYHLYAEVQGGQPGEAVMERFLKSFDGHLSTANGVFKRYLDQGILKPILLKVMQPGWFNAIVEDQISAGMRDTQFKPTILGTQPLCPERVAYQIAGKETLPA